MLSLRRSSSSKSSASHSYNLHPFEITHEHYSIVIHFLDDTKRSFNVNVSFDLK
jgi:hypothetical protein